MSAGKVVLGTMAGFAIGAIAGILFAPEKGSVTRKQIMTKGTDFVNDIKSKIDEYSGSLAEKLYSTKNEAGDLVSKGEAKYDELKEEVL